MAKRKVIKKAPLNKRIFAFLIDWYFGWVFAAIPVGWLWNVLTREKTINTDILLFEKPYGLLAGVLGILFGIVYYYVIPLKYDGQTLGKKFLSLKITDENGEALNAKDLAKRQIIGLLLLESPLLLVGNYVTQMITMYTFDAVGTVLNWVKVAILIISCFMVVKKGTAIHDSIAHSIVIEK